MHGHELLEAIAALVLVASGLVLVPAAWIAYRRPAAVMHSTAIPAWERPVGSALRLQAIAAAALLLGAAAIHLAVAARHLAEYLPYGVTSLALGTLQVTAAMAFAAVGVRRLRMPVIVLSLGVLAVWAWARTAGLPIGADASILEQIGIANSVAAILEGGLVVVLLVPIERLAAAVGRMRVVDAMSVAIVPVVGSVGLVTLIAIASMVPASHH
jgi:hypothetical protein